MHVYIYIFIYTYIHVHTHTHTHTHTQVHTHTHTRTHTCRQQAWASYTMVRLAAGWCTSCGRSLPLISTGSLCLAPKSNNDSFRLSHVRTCTTLSTHTHTHTHMHPVSFPALFRACSLFPTYAINVHLDTLFSDPVRMRLTLCVCACLCKCVHCTFARMPVQMCALCVCARMQARGLYGKV